MLTANSFFRIAVLTILASISYCGAAGGWDPIGDITHPERILRNVTRETNNAVNQGGPIVGTIAAPITGPLNAINGCMQDLRTCPQEAINQVPQAALIDICLRDINKCPDNVIKGAPASLVWPMISSYKQSLLTQAQNRWRSLPEDFVQEFSKEYPGIDLSSVRFATGINTIHGQAITFGTLIFFPGQISLVAKSDRELMLHELEHTAQYQRKGGERQFLTEYLLHGAGRAIDCRCVNIHDSIGTERDAISKASRAITDFGWLFYITNSCSKDLHITFYILNTDGVWRLHNYDFSRGESAFLSSRTGDRIHSINRLFFYYASDNDQLEWLGTDPTRSWNVNGEAKLFRDKTISPDAELFTLSLTCFSSPR